MTTTIVELARNILNEADATTGWSGDNSAELFTSDPDPVELTGHLGIDVGEANEYMEFTITSDDYSGGGTLSVWMQLNGTMDDTEGTTTGGGAQIVIGDGTDIVGYHVGGSDKAGFRHNEGPVAWQNFVLDPANLPEFSTVYGGTEANLNLAAITEVGIAFTTLSKALGGAANCFWDIIRWADIGVGVNFRGGTTAGAAGNGEEASIADRSDTSQDAHGVIHELAVGVYGIQGNVVIGDSVSSTDQFWEETNVTYAWEDRGLSAANYYRFALIGRTGQTSSVIFTSSTFSVPVAASASFDGNGADLDVVTMAACALIGFDRGVETSDDTGDDWTGCSYIGSNTVVANGCDLSDGSFTGSTVVALEASQDETDYNNTGDNGTFTGGTTYGASDTITLTDGTLITVDTVSVGAVTEFTVTTVGTGAQFYPETGVALAQAATSGSGTAFTLTPELNNMEESKALSYNLTADPDGELDNLTFTMGALDTHAIEFGASIPTTITLRGCDFNGYGSDSTRSSVFHFLDTSGTITVNLIDCTAPVSGFTVKDEGATINLVIAPVTTKITCENQAGDLLPIVRVFLETADDGGGSGFPYQAATASLTQSGGTATCTTSAVHGLASNDYVVIRGAGIEGYNRTAQITVTSTTIFTYTVDSGIGSPATGTPVVSYCPLSGLTATTGIIQSSKSWPASQGLTGWARKSTSAPYFKQTPLSITDASGGTDLLVLMISDE